MYKDRDTSERPSPTSSTSNLEMTSQCDVCDEVFSNNSALRRHRWSRHSVFPPFVLDGKEYVAVVRDTKFCCPLDDCQHEYSNREGLARHLRDVHNVVPNGSSPSPMGAEHASDKVDLLRGFESRPLPLPMLYDPADHPFQKAKLRTRLWRGRVCPVARV